jgi:hypothetical protein
LIGEEGEKAVRLISEVDWERVIIVLVSYSGSIDDMANMLSISSPEDGARLGLLEVDISRSRVEFDRCRSF